MQQKKERRLQCMQVNHREMIGEIEDCKICMCQIERNENVMPQEKERRL